MEVLKTAFFDYVTARGNGTDVVEQFVRAVLHFNSQYGSDISVSYSAMNLCGKPSNFPDYGDFPQSLVTRTYGKWWNEAPSAQKDYQPQNNDTIVSNDFVEILFQTEVYPTGIRIYETYNPGAVVRIWAHSRRGWVKLWEGEPQIVGHTSRLFRPTLRKANFSTSILRLEFSQLHLEDYTQLDGVLLEGTLKYKGSNDPSLKQLKNQPADDLAAFIMSLGLHNDLITEWKEFSKTLPAESLVMGLFHPLPDETVIKIFSYLDLRSLCRCAQVNKTFYRLASDPLLFRSVNLKPYWHCIDESVIYTLSNKATLLQKIDLSWYGCEKVPSYGCFLQLMQFCGSTLTHLRLNACRFVDHPIINCISDNCPNLRELSLNSCRYISVAGFVPLISLKKLTRLELYRTKIDPQVLLCIIRQNKGLRHLNLGSCVYLTSMDEVAIEIGQNCPDLISIDLWKNYSLTPTGIKALAKCTKLEEVDFGWCLQAAVSGDWVVELAKSCPNLKKIFMGALRTISDRDLRPISKLCPNLEQLDIFGSAITADVCELLLMNCKKLRLIDINFCEQIPEFQVVVWRQLYPSVTIKKCFVAEQNDVVGA
ncbi:F box and leucine-rich-repeat gene 4 isoform X2 [Arctopsyche grandis]|uniref:F box and leucine-rich-repeat gene 4 isoform X2 n=1 Tax=Arctopsyche grandis TaxID=121162 RepID=UPI00406D911E